MDKSRTLVKKETAKNLSAAMQTATKPIRNSELRLDLGVQTH
jgi:hypothetical protein